jgi:hypothetical protein
MTKRARAFVAGGMLLVGAAAPARAESFASMQYLGDSSRNQHRQVGALVLEGGELRFEDRKGRVVFVRSLAGAQAWVGAEKRTTAGSILRSTALMMAAIPLSSSGQVDPTQAWSRSMTPVLVVQLGEGAGSDTLRWRGPKEQLRGIAEAINRTAQESAALPPADSVQ